MGSNGVSSLCARTDGQYELTDGNPKNQKEVLEIKNIVTEMKNAFEGLIRNPDMPEEAISELESIPTSSARTSGFSH